MNMNTELLDSTLTKCHLPLDKVILLNFILTLRYLKVRYLKVRGQANWPETFLENIQTALIQTQKVSHRFGNCHRCKVRELTRRIVGGGGGQPNKISWRGHPIKISWRGHPYVAPSLVCGTVGHFVLVQIKRLSNN